MPNSQVKVYRKFAVKAGVYRQNWIDPRTGEIHSEVVYVSPQFLKMSAWGTMKMMERGIDVPVCLDHQESARPHKRKLDDYLADEMRSSVGLLKSVDYDPDSEEHIYTYEVNDPEIAKKIDDGTIKRVSPDFMSSCSPGDGAVYRNVIGHLALTFRPKDYRQSGEPMEVAQRTNDRGMRFSVMPVRNTPYRIVPMNVLSFSTLKTLARMSDDKAHVDFKTLDYTFKFDSYEQFTSWLHRRYHSTLQMSATGRIGHMLYFSVIHAPIGGVTIMGKRYLGGQFIPNQAMDQLDEPQKKELEASALASDKKRAEFHAKWKRPHENWNEALARHVGQHAGQAMSDDDRAAAKKYLSSLRAYHGENTIAKVAALAGAESKALADGKGDKAMASRRLRMFHEMGRMLNPDSDVSDIKDDVKLNKSGASKLIDNVMKNGGFTYRAISKLQPTKGFVVSTTKNLEQVVSSGEITPKHLQDYVDKNRDVLAQPNAHLGAWVDGGKVYLDVSRVFTDKNEALKLAEEHQQEGIYDLGNGKTIYTKWGNPPEGQEREAYQAAVPSGDDAGRDGKSDQSGGEGTGWREPAKVDKAANAALSDNDVTHVFSKKDVDYDTDWRTRSHAAMLHALTEHDRSESEKPGYNRYALAHYAKALTNISEHLDNGDTLHEAINKEFTPGRLRDKVLKSVDLPAMGGLGKGDTNKLREHFAKLQKDWLDAHKAADDHRSALEEKYGESMWRSAMSKASERQLEKLRAKASKASDRFYDLLDKISPRSFRYGVPTNWVMRKLNFDDATTRDKMSMTPDVAYGGRPSDSDEFANPVSRPVKSKFAVVHAHVGGENVQGHQYAGGQFVPGQHGSPAAQVQSVASNVQPHEIHRVVKAITGGSRTARAGQYSHTISPDKPAHMAGTDLQSRAQSNIHEAAHYILHNKHAPMRGADDAQNLLHHLGKTVNNGIIHDDHLIRRHADERGYGYSAPEEIPKHLENFYHEFSHRVNHADPVETAAWTEHTLNKIHPFSDGMGRTSKLMANWVLARHGLETPSYPQKHYHRNIGDLKNFTTDYKAWMGRLSPEDAQKAAMDFVQHEPNYAKMKDAYLKQHGTYDENGNLKSVPVDLDNWREHIPGYVGHNSAHVHEAAGVANDRFLNEMLTQMKGKGNGKVVILGGGGGCHGIGTPIMMADGSIKEVQKIKAGESLMGPDSLPRKVLRTIRGNDQLYLVTPTKGDAFVVNGDHILSVMTITRNKIKSRRRDVRMEISVNDALKRGARFFNNTFLHRSPVEFDYSPVPIDPYFLGIWIGDGTSSDASITSADPEIVDYLHGLSSSFPSLKLSVVDKKNNKSKRYSLALKTQKTNGNGIATNPLLEIMRSLGVIGSKYIPASYLRNSRDVRLSLLAGIIDTDGHRQNGGYEISTKYKHLAEQISYLARSLGFSAYVSTSVKASQLGTRGTYHRITIYGDVDLIPVKIARKKAHKRATHYSDGKRTRNVLHTGFKIEPIGTGDYYGFTLSGDGLYLMGDFTVTHNSGKGTSVGRHFDQNQYPIRIDQVSKGYDKLVSDAERYKAMGYQPDIVFVDRAPNAAWHGVVGRAMENHGTGDHPRTVPASVAVPANIEARQTVLRLAKERPDLPLRVINNNVAGPNDISYLENRDDIIRHLSGQQYNNADEIAKAKEHVNGLEKAGKLAPHIAAALRS